MKSNGMRKTKRVFAVTALAGFALVGLVTGSAAYATSQTTEECVPQEFQAAVYKTVHHDAVTETVYDRYSWTPARHDNTTDTPDLTGSTPLNDPERWQIDSKPDPKDDPIGVAFKKGNGENASWFFWTGTEIVVAEAYDEQVLVSEEIPPVECPDPVDPVLSLTLSSSCVDLGTYVPISATLTATEELSSFYAKVEVSIEGNPPVELVKARADEVAVGLLEPQPMTVDDYFIVTAYADADFTDLIAQEKVTVEACDVEKPEQPDPITGDEVTGTYACTSVGYGTQYIITTSWKQEYVWSDAANEWVLGDKVYGDPVPTENQVADESCEGPDTPKTPEVPKTPDTPKTPTTPDTRVPEDVGHTA